MTIGSVTHGNERNIKEILKCSDLYAQKMIDWAEDDEELNNLINRKLEEKAYRQPIVEV